jgi:hypothetical protein
MLKRLRSKLSSFSMSSASYLIENFVHLYSIPREASKGHQVLPKIRLKKRVSLWRMQLSMSNQSKKT